MKASLRDHLTILMSFAAVFLCGFGIGHLLAKRGGATRPAVAERPAWEVGSLEALKRSLQLDEAQTRLAEEELDRTAARIEATREAALLSYHEHLDELYGRLIQQLGAPHAARLKQEKMELERTIRILKGLNAANDSNPSKQ